MESNGKPFLDKVLQIAKDENAAEQPLMTFEHPKDLEKRVVLYGSANPRQWLFQKILNLDVTNAVNDEELERCVRQVLKYSVKTNKFTFKNQLFGATDPYGVAGAWLAEAFNTSQYTYEVAPAFTLVEQTIVGHMLKIFGFPSDGDGIFSPGGSISNMYAMVAARYRAFPDIKAKGMGCLPTLVIYTSVDSHYSVKKGAHWLGIGTDNIVHVKTNDFGQMIVSELDQAIQKSLDEGKYPLIVNATAGTTVLGAIDELDGIADICNKRNVWMHVDACWGGSLILSEKHKHKLRGIEKAHSIAWNPHKMLGAPLQCSAFLIRIPQLLHAANSSNARYLFQQDKFYDVRYDTGDKSVQCGRKLDSFKLWVMWKARGDAGFGSLVDDAMEMAEFCTSLLDSRPGFRLVVNRMQCPNVCFWYIPKFMRAVEENEEWWEKMHKITAKIKELLIMSSQLMVCYTPLRQHKNFFRMAMTCHPSTSEQDVLGTIQAIEECGETVTIDML